MVLPLNSEHELMSNPQNCLLAYLQTTTMCLSVFLQMHFLIHLYMGRSGLVSIAQACGCTNLISADHNQKGDCRPVQQGTFAYYMYSAFVKRKREARVCDDKHGCHNLPGRLPILLTGHWNNSSRHQVRPPCNHRNG